MGVHRDRLSGPGAHRTRLLDLGRVRRRPFQRSAAVRAAGRTGRGRAVAIPCADVAASDAKVLGVDVATVHRALGATDPATAVGAEEPAPIRGLDGKQYPRRRRPTAAQCSICGDVHDGNPDDCPWDLFAQGLGPRPVRQGAGLEGPSHDRKRADVVVEKAPGEAEGVAAHPAGGAVEALPAETIADSVTRAVCLVDELATLPRLVDDIEVAGATAGAGLVDVIRGLIDHLRAQAATMVALVGRLERITPLL